VVSEQKSLKKWKRGKSPSTRPILSRGNLKEMDILLVAENKEREMTGTGGFI